MNDWDLRKAQKMDNVPSDEEAELERVLTRLASISSDEARLEHVLRNLLPKLLERLQALSGPEIPVDKGPKKLLIETFSHVTRWVKSPSNIKLPVKEIADLINTKCERNSQALRVSMMFLDIGYDRSSEEEKTECLKSLLSAQSKLVDTEKSLVKFLFPTSLNLDRAVVRQHVIYLAELCLDCCYPMNFFNASTPKGARMALSVRPGRTQAEDHATRMRFAMSLVSRLVDWEPKTVPVAFCSSILAASVGPRDDVKTLGEDVLRRVRDASSEVDRDEKLTRLFELFLGTKERPSAPVLARIKTLEAIGRLGVGENMSDRLFQVLVKGNFGNEQTVEVKMQALRLMGDLSNVFSTESPSERFLSKSLRMLVSQPVDHLTSDHRAALFNTYAKWTASRTGSRKEMCATDIAIRILNTIKNENDAMAIDAEYQCLWVIGDALGSGAIPLLDSQVLLRAMENPSESASANRSLKLFAHSTAHKAVVDLDTSTTASTRLSMNVLWYLCLGSRTNENRQIRDASRWDLERIVLKSDFLPELLPSLETILGFIGEREQVWQRENIEPPKDYFAPVFRVIKCHNLILPASANILERVLNERILEGMMAFEEETRHLASSCLLTILSLEKAEWLTMDGLIKTKWTNVSLDSWLAKNLVSDHEPLRRTCAKLSGIPSDPPTTIPMTLDTVLKRLNSSSSSLLFADVHGALCASSYLGLRAENVSLALARWMVDPANKSNNENRDLRNEAFFSMTSIVSNHLSSTTAASIDNLPLKDLLQKAKEAIRSKSGEDSMEGIISFLGVLSSLNQFEDAFATLLSLTSDARFGLVSQQAIGKSLAKLDSLKLIQVVQQILNKSVFEEASQKARTSAAVLLEQIIRLGGSRIVVECSKEQLTREASESWMIDLVDGLVDLLSEVEEMSRFCACRALFELYFHVQIFEETSTMNHSMKERVVKEVHRRLTLGESNTFNPAQEQSSDVPAEPTPTTTTSNRNNSSRTTTTTTAAASQEQTNMTNASTGNSSRRVRRGRRGAQERVWGFQDLCVACQQCGASSMVLSLFGIIGCSSTENEEERSTLERALGVLKQEVELPSTMRLAVQFMRRRHYNPDDVATKASEAVFETRLKRERVFESPNLTSVIWLECARLLRDSFLARDRRSACLMMSEIASKLPDDLAFPCSMEDAWHSVFRALDDLDETIASGPATSLGRGIKRRTLIALRGESSAESSPHDVEALFAYLLDKGLSHPAKPARDLTRAFFVDAIAQNKLPLDFLCPVVEALLRTIGESEMVLLQYAQFHTRGGAGTGELAMEAKQLEEFRARIALESPEYRAAIKLASRMNSLSPSTTPNLQKIAQDVVMTVSRAVRTGIGLVALVAAVQMAGFVASEEWTPGSAVLATDVGPNLLGALSLKFATDPSQELKKRISSSAAMAARQVEKTPEGIPSVEAYSRVIADEYELDPEASQEKRKAAATACFELVKRQVNHLDNRLLRACFLGRFDEDLEVAQEWKNAFENGMQQLITPEDALEFCAQGVASNAYRARRQAARCFKGGVVFSSIDLARAAEGQLGMDLVRMSCSSANWDGKDELIKATGTVYSYCKEPDMIQFALFQLLDSALGENESKSTLTTTAKPKWLIEALFDAMGLILGGATDEHSAEVKERFLLRIVQNFKALPDEPLVLTATLKCASRAVHTNVSLQTINESLRLIVDLLAKSPTWNVRVASFELATQLFKANKVVEGDTRLVESFMKFLSTTFAEEKKPSVLLSALACGLQLRPKFKQQAQNDSFWSRIKPELERLEKNADVGVGKLAHELLALY